MPPSNITMEELIRKYEELIRKYEKVLQENRKLKEYVEELVRIVEKQDKIIQKLQRELRKYKNENTPSGSLPPYLKDTLHNIINTSKRKSKSSKSNGRKANTRNRRGEYNRVEKHTLQVCPYCNGPLKKRKRVRKRFILHFDFPEPEPVLHEINKYFCEQCNREVEPVVPDALPNTKFDLNLHIFILFLSVLGLTQRKITELLSILFGIDMSPASVNNAIHRVERYLGKKRYRELEKELRKSAVVHADETSWKHQGKTFWAWVVTNAKSVFYRIEKSRGTTTAKKIPTGEILVCDGYRPYDKLNKPIQRCWAHLLRKASNPDYFREDWEISQYKRFVEGLVDIYKRAKDVKERGVEVRRKFEEEFREYLLIPRKDEKNLRNLMNYILRYEGDWFTFLEYDYVEPTNNRAERMLRPVVIKRKIIQHTWSEEGREGLAVIHSLYETAKLRGENFIDILRNEINRNLLERRET